MKPKFQERFQIYAVGPKQDPRLATIAPGQVIEKIDLRIDLDAPFMLRARAVGPVASVPGLKTRWTGPQSDYRMGSNAPTLPPTSDFILESLQQPYFGQNGSPKPVSPEILYPPGGVLSLDLVNTTVAPMLNVIFYWIGVNLYPWGTLKTFTYPAEFRAIPWVQPFLAAAMRAPEIRTNLPYRAKADGDFAIRAGQAGQVGFFGGADGGFVPGVLAPTTEMSVVIKDYDGHAYMNDFIDINVLFGQAIFQASNTGFGTGPCNPGLIYPEIYLPANQLLFIDVQQSAAGTANVDLILNFMGAKIFKGATA